MANDHFPNLNGAPTGRKEGTMQSRELPELIGLLRSNKLLGTVDDVTWCIRWMQEGIALYGSEQIERYRALSLESWKALIAVKPAWGIESV